MQIQVAAFRHEISLFQLNLHITRITHILHIIHIDLFCYRNSKSSMSADDKDEGWRPLAKTSKTDGRLGFKTTALEVLLLDSYRLSVTELPLHGRCPGLPPVYCVNTLKLLLTPHTRRTLLALRCSIQPRKFMHQYAEYEIKYAEYATKYA
jgi:hypothetical protein